MYVAGSANTGYESLTIKNGTTTISSGSTQTINANTTISSTATVTSYTIAYNLNGGTATGSNPTTYNVTTDTITLSNPTRTGYTFTGWTGSNGETAQTTVTIAKGSTGNKSYTANWKDAIAPTVSVSSNTKYAKSQTATITIADADSGLASGTYTIKYAWLSSQTEPTWSSVTNTVAITASAGDKIKTATLTKSDGTGTYYLYVQAVDLKDQAGNTVSPTASGGFALDNTGPTITITQGTVKTNSIQVSVSATDSNAGMTTNPNYSYYIKKSSESYSSTATATTTDTSYTFTGLYQETYYDIKVTVVDSLGNSNSKELTSIKTGTVPDLTFGDLSWSNSIASVTVTNSSGDSSLTIKYKIGTSGTEKTATGTSTTVTDLKNGDVLYAWLSDGKNTGSIATLNVIETLSETTSYVGCYVDMDGDGTVDGVIFADLAVGGSGSWGFVKYGTYEFVAETALKEYYISKTGTTTGITGFDTKNSDGNVVSVVKSSQGNNRFYVLSLSDFSTSSYSTFYSYYSAYNFMGGAMSDYSDYTSGDFETGSSNTTKMITKWKSKGYGSQNAQDIWNWIQTKVNDGWFIPSGKEWSVFGNSFQITTSNYYTFGLTDLYLSSSQDSDNAFAGCYFGSFFVYTLDANALGSVRLATTF